MSTSNREFTGEFRHEFTMESDDYVDEAWVRKYVIPVLNNSAGQRTLTPLELRLRPIAKELGIPLAQVLADLHLRSWSLTIPGEPIAKARPKLGTVNGHAMAFTPAKTRRYEDVIRQRATLNWTRPLLADVPVTLRATFFRGIPQSWPKKKRADALLGAVRPIGKPDLDNLIKSCTDALCGVVLLDDAIIVDAHAQKLYALEPRVEISLSW